MPGNATALLYGGCRTQTQQGLLDEHSRDLDGVSAVHARGYRRGVLRKEVAHRRHVPFRCAEASCGLSLRHCAGRHPLVRYGATDMKSVKPVGSCRPTVACSKSPHPSTPSIVACATW